MSVVGGVAKAAGAKVLTGTRPARKALSRTKRTLVVMAFALLALLAAFAALIAASQVPSAKHSSVGTKDHESGAAAPVSQPGAAPQMSEEEAIDAYGKLPLSFIPNEGQTDKAVRYYAQGAGYAFFFNQNGAMLSFSEGKGRGGHALALDFLGADPEATLTARQRLSGEVNFLQGDEPGKWQQKLPTHAELLYGGLWPGIDMAVRGQGGKLKYEFHLKPGSSVEDVRLAYRGAEGLKVGADGELLVRTSLGILEDAAPVSYQRIGGERVEVKSRYRLTGDGGYGFAVGSYDPRYPLVIDPGLDYSTFLGGTNFDDGEGITVDEDGRAYVTGITGSAGYPTTGAFDTTFNGAADAFVTKLNASGSRLAYSTFLGGTSGDGGSGIAVGEDGIAYVTGTTTSSDFPTTLGAFDTTFNGGERDAFVTKLNAAGSRLVYSTFLGGTSTSPFFGQGDRGHDIALDGRGRAYVMGSTVSADFPATTGAFDTSFNDGGIDAFVTKLNAAGSALVYSTFLGGTHQDQGFGIAVRDGRAYVTGLTSSADYPITTGAFDTTLNGNDAFVTKLNAAGSALVYSTFLGGTNFDGGGSGPAALGGIAVGGEGSAYVTGNTFSSDFPTTLGAFDTTYNGDSDAFVTKFNASGSALDYSTFLGGPRREWGTDIAVDGTGRAYVTGDTESTDYPTTTGAFDTIYSGAINGGGDAFVTKFNASGSALDYSTFLGGTYTDRGTDIAVRRGRAYVTGGTISVDYPTTPGAFDTTWNSSSDVFVTKLPTG
jgi:hypothetical protein